MNKYLEKIAGLSSAIDKAVKFGSKVIGKDASTLRRDAQAMAKHVSAGRTPKQVDRMARVAERQTRSARVKLGLGAAATAGAGFLGMHKYHQHKDRAIMERLNKMYIDPEGSN